MTTLDIVRQAIVNELTNSRILYTPPPIDRDTDLKGDGPEGLRCDPLDLVCIALDIDDVLGTNIPEARLEALATVGEFVDLVDACRVRAVA